MHAVNAVAGRFAEARPFWLGPPTNRGRSTAVEPREGQASHVLEGSVVGRPLAELAPIETLLGARLIKIDVEGGELEVIEPSCSRDTARTSIGPGRHAIARKGKTR